MLEKIVHIPLDVIPSTNTYAKENYRQFDWDGVTRITATVQTAGRGRLGRNWVSPNEGNIYVTYFFTRDKRALDCSAIGLVFSLKIVTLLNQTFPLCARIKWPNDVLINDKKIAGVLCETIDLCDRFGMVLGAGINVNMSAETVKTVGQPATSLYVELGERQNVDPLMEELDTFFHREYRSYQKEGFAPFYSDYQTLLNGTCRPLSIRRGGKLFSGTFHSLRPDGQLNVRLESGAVHPFSSGEIVL